MNCRKRIAGRDGAWRVAQGNLLGGGCLEQDLIGVGVELRERNRQSERGEHGCGDVHAGPSDALSRDLPEAAE